MNSENELYQKLLEQLKEISNLLKTHKSIVKPKEDKNMNIEINIKKIGGFNQKEYNRDYYQNNKDKYKIKHVCNDCKGTYTLSTKSYHFKSKMHKKIIDALKPKPKPTPEQTEMINNAFKSICKDEIIEREKYFNALKKDIEKPLEDKKD